jgi:hypothetical protein
MQQEYLRIRHRRALSDARHALRIETGERVVISVFVGALSILLVWFIAGREAAGHEMAATLAAAIAVALVFPVVYVWKFLAAPAKMHAELASGLKAAKQTRTHLQVRHGQYRPYNLNRHGFFEWYHRIGVYNAGSAVAGNVKVSLLTATKPRYPIRNDFPYRVVRVGTDWRVGTGMATIQIEDVDINPGEEELYEVMNTWVSSDGRRLIGKIDTKPDGKHYYWGIEPDERWELQYEVTAANADPVRFTLGVFVRDDALIVERTA